MEYKAVRMQGIYYNAAFQDNLFLIDWVNSQNLVNPLVCLGDGHNGVWKRESGNWLAQIGGGKF